MRYQDQHFRNREQAILDAALQLFQQQPWDRVTIAEVAIAAGIGKGTVYKHVPSKEALYAALVLAFNQRCLLNYQQLYRSTPAQLAMRTVIRQGFSDFHADPVMAQLCMHCDRPDFRERLDADYQQQFYALEEQFRALFAQLLDATLAPQRLAPQHNEQLLLAVESCFTGVIARIATGGFSHWNLAVEMNSYYEQITDFIIVGLRGQATQLLSLPAERTL
jgi:AcrR family transcriptional regulator